MIDAFLAKVASPLPRNAVGFGDKNGWVVLEASQAAAAKVINSVVAHGSVITLTGDVLAPDAARRAGLKQGVPRPYSFG